MTTPTFTSTITVDLIDTMGSDARVAQAARVSTIAELSLAEHEGDNTGLIGYLMRDRHGCYDADTDVLTGRGWVSWPNVVESDTFATLSSENEIQYQSPVRLIRKVHSGPMMHIKTRHLDLMVTPDHKMLAKRRKSKELEKWELVPASDLHEASHRIRLGGGDWIGRTSDQQVEFWALLGFFIGDGYAPGKSEPTFHITRPRKIAYLKGLAQELGFQVKIRGDHYTVVANSDFREFMADCYDEKKEKVVPARVLQMEASALHGILDGLINSDGSISAQGKTNYSTTSVTLRDQFQELALKCGVSASSRVQKRVDGDGSFGSRDVHHLTVFRARNATPRVGWTRKARSIEVTNINSGPLAVFCATVPNGTLYVRRNGQAAWCGNSPFEHAVFTFYVHAPIFVFREFMRHRMASYNEESGRYSTLKPVFYTPGPERKLRQVGKPGAYEFVDGIAPVADAQRVEDAIFDSCTDAYAGYERMLERGIAKEVARMVLPVNIFSSMYVTMNARSLMNFLSLRTKSDDSTYPSFPQREIEMVAEQMEVYFQGLLPITHAAFVKRGRVSP